MGGFQPSKRPVTGYSDMCVECNAYTFTLSHVGMEFNGMEFNVTSGGPAETIRAVVKREQEHLASDIEAQGEGNQ